MSKDLRSSVYPYAGLGYTTVTGTATGAGAVIDRLGYESVTFLIHNHACNGTSVVSYQLAAGAASGSLSVVATGATGGVIGATSQLTTSGATGVVKSLGYSGDARYVQLQYLATGTATGSSISAVALLGNADSIPTVSATA